MSDHHRRRRIVRLLALAVVLELGLFQLARMAPAMSRIARTGMIVVLVGVAIAIVYAMRSRSGNDRRQSDRRHEFEES